MDDRREVDQEGITNGFDDMAVMFSHCLLDNLVMHFQQPQHAGFVRAHLAAEADDVGEHDRRQPAGLGLSRHGFPCVWIILLTLPQCQPESASQWYF